MAFNDHYIKRVSYFHDSDISSAYFGEKHPMKPTRIAMTHDLVVNYGLYQKMKIFRPEKATATDLMKFHSEDYVSFLSNVTPQNLNNDMKNLMKRFGIGTSERDCPVFDGLYNFCQISAGSSIAAAVNLNKEESDICINWAGGLHHAKKDRASGFCYVNDIVLAILELLKFHQRVLYIDIDVHHGDGVEEAFFSSNRVMTVSFHQHGTDFFPGTGGIDDIGIGKGQYYKLNVPLKRGMDDESYIKLFIPIMNKVMEVYCPSVIVLQCGADSLAGDRLGDFNLTIKGHGQCVEFIRNFNIPLLLLGGGGYTPRNVSRCWTYETSIALKAEISNDLPYNDFFEYFQSDLKLHFEPDATKENENTPESCWNLVKQSIEKLRNIQAVPSVPIQERIDFINVAGEDKNNNFEARESQDEKDKRLVPANEFFDE